ncbi:MAG: arsinothricin resistance N-acetyltransferase ArsN1 family B [Actinomycetota bacterium]
MLGCIRVARPDDAAAVAAIYGPVVRDTAISFEATPPGLEEMHERIERTLREFPWLVFESEGDVLGYAYAGPFKSREAYRWSVELSVYVDRRAQRQGIGKALMEFLLAVLERQGHAKAYAGITLPNPGSVGLFESLGFEPAGVFRDVGNKLGRWHDVGWWQRCVADLPPDPTPPTPFAVLRNLEGATSRSG